MNIIFSPFFFSFLRYFSGKKRITIKEFTFKLITKYANCKFIFKININYFTYIKIKLIMKKFLILLLNKNNFFKFNLC